MGSNIKPIKTVHWHEVKGFQIVIVDTWEPSSQTQNQTENLGINKTHTHKIVKCQHSAEAYYEFNSREREEMNKPSRMKRLRKSLFK